MTAENRQKLRDFMQQYFTFSRPEDVKNAIQSIGKAGKFSIFTYGSIVVTGLSDPNVTLEETALEGYEMSMGSALSKARSSTTTTLKRCKIS